MTIDFQQHRPHSNHHHHGNTRNNDDDVVIVAAIRTPLIRASNAKKEGQFGNVSPAELLQTVLAASLQQVPNMKGADVQDLCVGNVLMVPSNFVTLRMAAIAAGLSAETCSMNMVNRQCASGLQAIANIANRISANEIDIGIGAGVESMSIFPMNQMKLTKSAIDWTDIVSNKEAMDCLLPMGITSDTVAIKYHQKVITVPSTTSSPTTGRKVKLDMDRLTLDAFAVESHRRAHAAQTNGSIQSEICPVRNIQRDDGVRANATIDGLLQLKPIFTPKTGVTTAGNSSQLTDGAAAVIVMRRSVAKQRNIPILAVWKGYTCCGVPPSVMGIGPSVAIPELLHRLQLNINDIDRIELNEAFATQALYCIQVLQLDVSKVNVNGGAIALGHPLGATGARMIVSLINSLHQLKNNQPNTPGESSSRNHQSRYGCASMCVGTGMGAAAIIEVETETGNTAVHPSMSYGLRRSSL